MKIKELEDRKLIKEQKISFNQIIRHLQRAKKDLKTAKANKKIDSEWAYTIAYQGMLKAGRALMFLYGYKPIDGLQHLTVVEFVEICLGKQFSDLINQFERMRRQRNALLYEPGESISKQELIYSFQKAEQLIKVIERKIKQKNPQKELF